MNPSQTRKTIKSPLQCDASRGLWGHLFDNAIGFVGVLLLAKLSYLLKDGSQSIVQFWPVSGFAIGLLLRRGVCILPALSAGAFLAPLLQGQDPLVCAGFMVAGIAEWLLYSFLFWRFLTKISLTRLLTLPLILICVAAISAGAAAIIGSLVVVLVNDLPIKTLGQFVVDWWHGDFIGIIVVSPLIVSFKWTRFTINQLTKATALLVLLMVFGALLYEFPSSVIVPFSYLALILLSVVWFPTAGPYWLNAGACTLLVVLTYNGHGPFVYQNGDYKHVWLGFYLIAIGVTALHAVYFPFRQNKITIVPLTALIGGILFSAGVYAYLTESDRKIHQLRLEELASDAKVSIQNRLDIYINALRSGASLYQVKGDLNHGDWVRFANSLDMPNRYPGINGIGVIEPVEDENVVKFVEGLKAEGLVDFSIKRVPNVDTPSKDGLGYGHYIIRYIEPLGINHQALGLNVGSEANRQRAAMISRDTGTPQITSRIVLVQDGKKRPGFLLMVPSYEIGMPLTTVEERQAAFERWIYAPFITELLFEGVMQANKGLVDFSVFDSGRASRETFAYSSFSNDPEGAMDYSHQSTLHVAGQEFTVGWREGARLKSSDSMAPLLAGIGFGVVSVLFTGLIASLINANHAAGELVRERTHELINLNDRLEEENADRKTAESEALAANQAKSEFLAVMSHEIRTPLNSVIGFSDVLRRSRLDTDQREWTDAIISSARQLLGLIDDVLDFSKIEANRLSIEKSLASPLDLTRDIIRLMSPLANEKKNYLKLNVGGKIPDMCMLDSFRVRQVLTNLIGNANKFTDGGEVEVSIGYESKKKVLCFAVEDEGIGVSQEEQLKLFQPFAQADGTTTRKYGGTGLGLIICKKLIEMMGGRIKLTSEVGKGTRVAFSIPVDLPEEDQLEDQLEDDSILDEGVAGFDQVSQKSILVVEDVPLNQKLARLFLEKLDCDVDIANNGEEAMAKVREKSYEVILMDYHMPGMNGIEAAKTIQQWEDEHRNGESERSVRIVAMTANVSNEFRDECKQAGMDGFLAKPFTLDDLREVLAELNLD